MRSSLLVFLGIVLVIPTPDSPRAQWVPDGVGVCTDPDVQQEITIVSDAQPGQVVAGGAIVVWVDLRGFTGYDIYAQRIYATGYPAWTTNGVALCTAPNAQIHPQAVPDDQGGAIVTWQDHRSGTDPDIYAQRVNAAGAPQWTPDGVVLCAAVDDQIAPAIVSDGALGAIVTRTDFRNGQAADIYAQRVDGSGIPQWTPDGVAVCSDPFHQVQQSITSDLAGGAIIAWQDIRNPPYYDIYAQRVSAVGVPQWTTDGVALCTAPDDQSFPELISDASGGAIVTWSDRRNTTDYDIYVQRVDASGIPQWAADGEVLCKAADHQGASAIVTDQAGGAIVAWQDFRNGSSNADIFARRVDASGTPTWLADGVALCTAANDQMNPELAIDGAGGALVTWQDQRIFLNTDIFAQRVDASGTPLFVADGIGVCNAVDGQFLPQIATDQQGGAIVTWQDFRNSPAPDVYAQHIGPLRTATDNTPPITRLLVRPNHPNPFAETTTLEVEAPATSRVEIEVYDVAGREVRAFTVGGRGGWQSVPFDGRDDLGRPLASGVYFYRVRADGTTVTRKMTIAR